MYAASTLINPEHGPNAKYTCAQLMDLIVKLLRDTKLGNQCCTFRASTSLCITLHAARLGSQSNNKTYAFNQTSMCFESCSASGRTVFRGESEFRSDLYVTLVNYMTHLTLVGRYERVDVVRSQVTDLSPF